MKKYIFALTLSLILMLKFGANEINAIYDPLSVPNNKFGIHLLFPEELSKAKELVNSKNGEWGYVVIPIQAGDKDLIKWQKFMDECRKLKLIPLVRLSTEGDYFDKSTWRKPTDADVVDFANFLNSLEWPTKNRYIIVFNEVNRADEWNGEANPAEYANILSYAVSVFKSKNPDFFIIQSGMDNASITGGGTYSQYDFFRGMNDAVPGIFNQIDGHSSHSYPNPAFSQPPEVNTITSTHSFMHELQLIESMSNKKLPVFITETGWDQEVIGEKETAEYFKTAFSSVWNKENIVTVAPFLLHSGPGPFQKFSFLNDNGEKNEVFKAIQSIDKTRGKPKLNPAKKVLGEHKETDIPVIKFEAPQNEEKEERAKSLVRWILLGI